MTTTSAERPSPFEQVRRGTSRRHLDAARELAQVTAAGRATFLGSVLHVRAAERLLEIIGEASNALSDTCREEHPDIAWRDITALRILLAHHYHRIDPEQVWEIATGAVAGLADQLGT